MKLKIEYVDIDSIKAYKNNAKKHPPEQIEQIKKSIEQFGMDDPIGIWKNEVVEGHGRLIACRELGHKQVPIIRLDHLTNEERKAYMLVHNKLTLNSDFDVNILNDELEAITSINMLDYGFVITDEELEDKYTKKINTPQYEMRGIEPAVDELVDDTKAKKYLNDIEKANVTEEQKEFLRKAVSRLYVFDYKNIAEYYAHQDAEMQKLMERLALVLIDYNDAILNGYVELSEALEEIRNDASR